MSQLPQAFLDRMQAVLGDAYPEFLRTYDEPYRRGIRLNPLKRCGVLPEGLGAPVRWEPTGYQLSVESTAGAVSLHEAGAWYLQEPSAMLPAAVMDPQPGERILDLCAAPGGKSTQLGLRMNGEGLLVSNEIVPKRAQILSRNIERMGIANAVVTCAHPETLARAWPEGFDGVLVDAPCSGEGMFRRHPETRDEWTPDSPAGCAARQAEILDSAAKLVRPGGRIVYSTCTLNRTENEDTVSAFCNRHPDFRPTAFCVPGICGPDGYVTLYPHQVPGEGHFCALLMRDGDAPAVLPEDVSLPKPDKAALAVYRDFIRKLPDAPQATHLMGTVLVSAPILPSVRGLKVLRCGLHLGEVRGKLFLPDHAWAVAANSPAFPDAELDDEQILRYLHGETVEADESLSGWVLCRNHGLSFGWGKASGGTVKNHYPKGLRR